MPKQQKQPITGKNYAGVLVRLVNKDGSQVCIGDKIERTKDVGGDFWTIATGGQPPHGPDKSGYIYVNDSDSTGPDSRYYAHVYDMKWIA